MLTNKHIKKYETQSKTKFEKRKKNILRKKLKENTANTKNSEKH